MQISSVATPNRENPTDEEEEDYYSAFAKAKEVWNKQSRSSKASDVIKDNIGFLLQVPTVTQ